MITRFTNTRQKRKARIAKKIRGTHSQPRLSVFRSQRAIYAQLIDDTKGITLLGATDRQTGVTDKNKITRANALGRYLAKEAAQKKISQIVFDRSGYNYHGRVKALAEGLREGGLKF